MNIYRHYRPDPELEAFIVALPKTETHLHIEGCVSFEQLNAFNPKRYPNPPPFWDPSYRFESFDRFNEHFFEWVAPYHTTVANYHETAKQAFAKCAAQGVRHIEASFHLPAISWLDDDGPALLDAIHDAAPDGISVRIFGGMTHADYGRRSELLERALTWDRLAGIDLHGPEYWPVDDGIPDYWRRAKDLGKVTKAHAGEFMGAPFVEWVVDTLGVARVEHGVRAIESAQVVDILAERSIVLDVCPISNLKLAVEGVSTMSAHPIRKLMEAGVCVTVSTDDTFMFGNSLIEEYTALVQSLGFDRTALIEIARNGVRTASMDEAKRAALERELDELQRLTLDAP